MIHKEGGKIIVLSFVLLLTCCLLAIAFLSSPVWLASLIALVIFGLVVQFFRNPDRSIANIDDILIYAPADGKVVVIEETLEEEFLNENRIQISIFMSPLNVHVNRIPFSGFIKYFKYHPGKFLVAWHPKSSSENERTTLVIEGKKGSVLMRQIAGAVARRIRWYIKEKDRVTQGQEMGFIKFGSRVDLFIPLDADVQVKIGDMVKGNRSVIAKFKEENE